MEVSVVLAVRDISGSGIPAVSVDDREGGRLAAEHLLALGPTRLAQLGDPSDISSFEGRAGGFPAEASASGLEVIVEQIQLPTVEAGRQPMETLFVQVGNDLRPECSPTTTRPQWEPSMSCASVACDARRNLDRVAQQRATHRPSGTAADDHQPLCVHAGDRRSSSSSGSSKAPAPRRRRSRWLRNSSYELPRALPAPVARTGWVEKCAAAVQTTIDCMTEAGGSNDRRARRPHRRHAEPATVPPRNDPR